MTMINFLCIDANIARSEFNEAEDKVRDVVNKLQEINDVLNLDFGEDDRFAPMLGQCYELQDREYIYTLCPFKSVRTLSV